MTTLLQRAIAEVEKLPAEDQDAIAARLLEEIEDERRWDARFASTTDDQWDRLATEVRREVAEEGVLPPDEDSPVLDRQPGATGRRQGRREGLS
jgi:hypothetical protein